MGGLWSIHGTVCLVWSTDPGLRDESANNVCPVIFGKESVHCPTAEACYCNVFGLCDLACPEDGSCVDHYALPLSRRCLRAGRILAGRVRNRTPAEDFPRFEHDTMETLLSGSILDGP